MGDILRANKEGRLAKMIDGGGERTTCKLPWKDGVNGDDWKKLQMTGERGRKKRTQKTTGGEKITSK